MSRWVTSLIACALVAGAFVGCQRKKKPSGEEKRTAALPVADVPMHILSEALLAPGAAPQQILRYGVSEGDEMELRVQASAEISEVIDGTKRVSVTLPVVTTRFALARRGTDLEVTARAAEMAASTPDGEKAARQLIQRYDSMLVDKSTRLPLSDRGHLGTKPISGLAASDKTLAREYVAALADFVVPLPASAVGIGAKWTVVRAIPRATTRVKQTLTIELLERRGDIIVVAVSGSLVGERQALDAPNLPPRATAELLALRATVSGRLELDLRRSTAVSGKLVRHDTIHTRAKQNGLTIADYFSESKTTLVLTTAKPAPAPTR